MLHEMGIETGTELAKLIDADARRFRRCSVSPLGAHVLRAGPVDWQPREAG